jgi:uncharacterized C2H2 Zn-finger protein
MPTESEYKGFECPTCGYRRYQRVVVNDRAGGPYETEFYACASCTVMFTDPVSFTQHSKYKTAAQTDIPWHAKQGER